MLRFVVIADSHIRPPDQEVDAYPSNALLVQRNEFIVDLCNEIDPAFVVHLGDIVHPLPVEESHDVALALASGVYAKLTAPIHFAPGNHDVGDKPNAHVAVPAVSEDNYPKFESTWGPPYTSFDQADCHFVVVDAQVMNTGFPREHSQARWLEADLSEADAAGQRLFLFMHYPPFVRDAAENEHYDNIGEPARSWFLDLLETHGVEAVFCGHVHNFQFNRHGNTDLYVVPSTGFVRPDYAELAAVVPELENGRDDPAKLGIFVVDIFPWGHQIHPVRSFGSTGAVSSLPIELESFLDPGWKNPLGVTLSHSWKTVTDFPTAGLDAYARKRVRDDATVLALWEARITKVRIPLDDLRTDVGFARAVALHETGTRFSVFSAGVPDSNDIDFVRTVASVLDRWEIAAFPSVFGSVVEAVDREHLDVPLALAPIVPIGSSTESVHHFVASGFDPWEVKVLDEFHRLDSEGNFPELAFRVTYDSEVRTSVLMACSRAARIGRRALVIVELPRDSESRTFSADGAVAQRVVQAARSARDNPECAVFLDGFMDHDRGYYPRHSLIDRRSNPRQALYDLIAEVSLDFP